MSRFQKFADATAHVMGMPAAFITAVALTLLWAVSGPLFGYSDTWQLVINTGTTVLTFLMVFLIQATQNRDNAATQAKLDELIRSSQARDEMAGIDRQTEREIEDMRIQP